MRKTVSLVGGAWGLRKHAGGVVNLGSQATLDCKTMAAVLLLLASLVTVSVTVSPPNIADTFVATGEVEIHTAEGTSIGGSCKKKIWHC